MPTFFLTAAEHSGDALGEALIRALRKKFPTASFTGVGGDRMAAAGCKLLANPVTHSAMLLNAILTQSTYWYKLLRKIKTEFRNHPPAVVIPIDSSFINLRIAAAAKKQNLPVCYYVAPQIWASRPWRIKKIRPVVDTLCCILPFEEKYFRDRQVNAVYVGHPMFDTPANAPQSDPARATPPFPIPPATQDSGLRTQDFPPGPRIALFPGSRRAEIDAHMPPMLEILSEIKGRFPNAAFVAVAPSEDRAWQIRHHLKKSNTPVDIRVATQDSGPGGGKTQDSSATADAAIRWADLVLTKSGTATLQIAKHHKPMVVLFSVAWYKWHLVAKHFITTPHIALVNILANRRLVPEFIPFYGSPLPIAKKCIDLLANPAQRQQMSTALAQLVAPLHPHENTLAADRVATEVAKLVPRA